jgi:hypothetical protein
LSSFYCTAFSHSVSSNFRFQALGRIFAFDKPAFSPEALFDTILPS